MIESIISIVALFISSLCLGCLLVLIVVVKRSDKKLSDSTTKMLDAKLDFDKGLKLASDANNSWVNKIQELDDSVKSLHERYNMVTATKQGVGTQSWAQRK